MTEEEFWQILHAPVESNPIFYRLYHDDRGSPIIYSMEALSGNYIEVDQETYVLAPYNVRVVDGALVRIKPVITVRKLQPTESNGTACDTQDVCVVVDQDQAHTTWTMVNNEID